MKHIWTWVKQNPNRTMFLIPIILVAGISISHVVAWYNIANPFSWAVYLSIAIEVGAMTALVAATNKIKGGVWFMFGLITLIQMIGNIFFSYKEINENGELFKAWIELSSPVWEVFGTEPGDIVSLKRWLAFLEGGLLPIISLTSLHFFVKYEGKPVTETVIETIPETTSSDSEEEGSLAPNSVSNSIYEITKEVYESNEKQIVDDLPEKHLPLAWEKENVLTQDLPKYEKTPEIETFVSEEEYLDLQASHSSVNDTVNDTVNEGVNERLFWAEITENTELQSEVIDEESHDNIKRLSYVKDTQR